MQPPLHHPVEQQQYLFAETEQDIPAACWAYRQHRAELRLGFHSLSTGKSSRKLQEWGLLCELAPSENSSGTGVSCLDKGDTTFAWHPH